MFYSFLYDVSCGNHDGMLRGMSGDCAQGFIRRNDKVMLVMACVVITNVSDT